MTWRAARPIPALPGPGQESVWDYPRPPRLERSGRTVTVRSGDLLVARTERSIRILETSHPPNWYLPPADIEEGTVRPAGVRGTVCEFKGAATYWDVRTSAGSWLPAAAWSYPEPSAGYREIADHLAFYPGQLTCEVDGERVRPQDGGFYGGWVTDDVVGPFKGAPGTMGW